MNDVHRGLLILSLLTFALASGVARADSDPESHVAQLNLGADYWSTGTSIFSATVSLRGYFTPRLSIGGRAGALVTTSSSNNGSNSNNGNVGIPLDLQVRGRLAVFYLEGLAGPWLLINSNSVVRAHVAAGGGLEIGPFSAGLEMGYLDPAAVLGVRLGLGF